jgi:predicted Ser/Thr protein kinase
VRCPACHSPFDDLTDFCPHCGAASADAELSQGTDTKGDSVRHQVQEALGAEYRLLNVLGSGGMGVVYLARQQGLERLVAVKVLSPSIAATESRERFRREARMAAGLTHPGILPVYAFGEAGELPYIVMGYVRSETLADRLQHQKCLPVERARRILADLANALDYAHRHGVIHRDIKPENILLEDESERALLMDFGIAKSNGAAGTLTATGVAVGTPGYMSPEQRLGDSIDGRSDIYSLGLVAYEMLAGYAPFAGPNEAFRGREATPLAKAAPNVPEDLARVIMRCLAQDPNDRWPDARSFCVAVTRGDAEAGVPDELRAIAGFGSWALLWFVVWGVIATRAFAAGSGSVMLLLSALLVPVGFALQGLNVHRAGFGLRQILSVGFWPPKWWGLWWPGALRRPDDMWHELPHSARLGRIALTVFFVATPSLAYVERLAAGSASLTPGILRSVGYVVIALTAVAIAVLALRWRSRGVGSAQLARWLVGSTTSGSFWSEPQISPLLRPVNGEQPTGPSTPHEYLRSISDFAEALAGSARAPGSDAIAAARTLLGRIASADAEIASLRRNADPIEVLRVEERLAVLGEGNGPADNDQAQMQSLLRRQLALFTRLKARQEQVVDARSRLIEQLRSLWAAVRDLGKDEATPSARTSSAEALRALCAAIEHAEFHHRRADLAAPIMASRLDAQSGTTW